jgi:N6-adenosine-specific RNA methylase IME4
MPLQDICSLPVADLATDEAILFVWTTSPYLVEALQVVLAWGFKYKTNIAWVKDKVGLGYVVRNRHELLLVATRGDIPSPLPANRPSSVIEAPRREHSRKPDEAYELIERMYPELPKIELFARQARPGWACWGNPEAPLASRERRLLIREITMPVHEQHFEFDQLQEQALAAAVQAAAAWEAFLVAALGEAEAAYIIKTIDAAPDEDAPSDETIEWLRRQRRKAVDRRQHLVHTAA